MNTATTRKTEITIADKTMPCVRTICFGDNQADPYVLFHPSPGEFDDEKLEAFYGEWFAAEKAGNTDFNAPETAEEFEEFLHFLEREKGFVYLVVADATYQFK
ncbi:MAG TPA: hypothetical protein VK308_14075 [Pyrinomonadaceae bacterium]|nr:hypothetical protein [Pyrinomonadaceae bacterium]